MSEQQDRQEALASRGRRQAALAGLARRAEEPGAPRRIYDDAVAVAAEALAVDFVSAWEILPGGARLRLRATHGFRPGLVGVAEVSAAPAASQAGYTLAAGRPVVVPDLPSERRFAPPPILVEHGATSGMSVVIEGATRPHGVLAAHSRRPHAFGREEVEFLQGVAAVVSAAVERDAPSRPHEA